MAEKIDEAYVEINPDVDDFARDANRELSGAFRDIERKLDDVVDSIEDGFDRLIKSLEISFDNLAYDVRNSLDSIGDGASSAGREISSSMGVAANAAEHAIDDMADDAVRDLRRIERQANDTGRSMFRSLAVGAGTAGMGAISQLSEVGSVLRNLGSIPTSVGGAILTILKIASIAAAVPAVIALTGALINLSAVMLTIPAAGGILIAAIAPIPIAMMGVGDAIKALVEGDMEKLNEALKKLSPSARSFVGEVRGLLKPLRELRSQVQEAFFEPLRGTLTALGKRLLPVVAWGLAEVAQSIGRVAAKFGELLSSGDVVGVFRDLFASTSRFVEIVGPSLVDLIGTFFGQMQHGLPFIERFGFWLADVITKFGEWSAAAIGSGRFMEWINEGIEVLKSLGRLVGSVFRLIKALAGDAGDEGRTLIDTLTEMTNRLAAFFESAEGQEFLQNMLDGLKFAGMALMFFVDVVAFVGKSINAFYDGVQRIKVGFAAFWAWMQGVGASAGSTFTSIGAWITSMWTKVVAFFTTTVPKALSAALDFVTRIPGMLRDQAVAAFDNLFFVIGFGIGTILQYLADLPFRVAAIFTAVWNTAVSRTQEGLARIGLFFNMLPEMFMNTISRAWSIAKSLFQQGVDNSITTVNTLPGRVWSALNSLAATIRRVGWDAITSAYGVGRDITNGIINGISDGIGRLVETAKRAARSALEGAKRALGIASPSKEWAKLGVASVDGYVGAVDKEMHVSAGDIATAVRAPLGETTNNTTNVMGNHAEQPIYVTVLIGDDEIEAPTIRIIRRNPQEITKASESGSTQLGRRR